MCLCFRVLTIKCAISNRELNVNSALLILKANYFEMEMDLYLDRGKYNCRNITAQNVGGR